MSISFHFELRLAALLVRAAMPTDFSLTDVEWLLSAAVTSQYATDRAMSCFDVHGFTRILRVPTWLISPIGPIARVYHRLECMVD